MSLPGGHLESLGGGWLGLLLGACLAGELGVAGAPGEWDAWMFFSSEKKLFNYVKEVTQRAARDLGLAAGLVGAEQLGLDGLNHTLETPAGT